MVSLPPYQTRTRHDYGLAASQPNLTDPQITALASTPAPAHHGEGMAKRAERDAIYPRIAYNPRSTRVGK